MTRGSDHSLDFLLPALLGLETAPDGEGPREPGQVWVKQGIPGGWRWGFQCIPWVGGTPGSSDPVSWGALMGGGWDCARKGEFTGEVGKPRLMGRF